MKKPAYVRIEETLIDRVKKLAKKNKDKLVLPDNYNAVIQQAIVEYLAKYEKD